MDQILFSFGQPYTCEDRNSQTGARLERSTGQYVYTWTYPTHRY